MTGLIGSAAAITLLTATESTRVQLGQNPSSLCQVHEVFPNPELEITNAITIFAPAERIWPWLVQLGYYRGGWFTHNNITIIAVMGLEPATCRL